MSTYDELIAEAVAAPVPDTPHDAAHGGVLAGRMTEAATPWSYGERARELAAGADGPVLDLGDGRGGTAGGLPSGDGQLAVLLNRQQPYRPDEVSRVLRTGGVFLTEQLGGLDGLAVNEALEAPYNEATSGWSLSTARADLEAAGLRIAAGRTAFPERVFHDVGALVYYLRTVPRQVPDFSVERYDKQLRILHDQMSAGEPLRDRGVRFLLEAVRD